MMTETMSLSNSFSKLGTDEDMSMFQASMEDASSRLAGMTHLASISNEQILKGDPILDTYEVISDAIHGGMGSVWRVYHKNWDVELAMKRPQPRYFTEGDEDRKAGFLRECENWIGLGLHPNIVSCYYVREIGGVPTIFSEWMDGGSLKDRIKDGSLYEESGPAVQARILDIALQAVRGLEYSHEHTLIHQDVKPGNILLTKDWDARLADFGLARAGTQLSDGNTQAFSGYTPQYCPKEQTEGNCPKEWMDLYAWAVTVLEMYAGQRFWTAGSEVKDSFAQYAGQCRIPMPEPMKQLLEDVLHRHVETGTALADRLAAIYRIVTGMPYMRPKTSAAEDTADSLNNRALSFLDLGKRDTAEQIWNEAIRMDYSNFRCHYNLAVALWQANRISAEELRKRILAQKEDSDLYRAAEKDTEFAELITAESIRRSNWITGGNEPLPEEPYHTVLRFRMGDKKEGYCTSDYECPLDQGDLILDDSPDGKRRLGVDAAGKRYFLEEEGIRRTFRTCMEDEYIPERNNLTVKRFTDADGKIAVDHSGYTIRFFNAETGRSLLNYNMQIDSEGDEILERVWKYSENGFAYLSEYNHTNGWWMKLPPADPQLNYSLSRIASFAQRQASLEKLVQILPVAEKAFDAKDYTRCMEALKPFAEDGSLLLYAPALELWQKLFDWFEPEKMITVLTDDPVKEPDGRWLPGGGDPKEPDGDYTEANAEDAYTLVTSSYTEYTKENYNNSMDVTLFYTVRGTDAVSGRPFYTFKFKENERDDVVFSYNEWFKVRGQYIWMKKPEEKKPWHIDLADPVLQERFDMELALPGGYVLKNREGRVHIGDYVFEDVYEGLDLLSDRQIIRCRNHSYRLIYQYGKRWEKPVGLWSEYVSENPVLPKEEKPVIPENEEIHAGDRIAEEYTVISGPVQTKNGCIWQVRGTDGNVLRMYRQKPSAFGGNIEQNVKDYAERTRKWIQIGSHDTIVACHDVRNVGGIPALFTDVPDGTRLSEMREIGSLYEGTAEDVQRRIISIALDTSRALKYAHRKGVTHNSVRSDSIYVSSDGKAELDMFAVSAGSRNPRAGDVWDWARTILELYAGKELYSADPKQEFDSICAACRVMPSKGMQEMLRSCLNYQISDIAWAADICEKELQSVPEQKNPEPVPAQKPAEVKKGFFARLFGKKDQ